MRLVRLTWRHRESRNRHSKRVETRSNYILSCKPSKNLRKTLGIHKLAKKQCE